LTIVEPAVLVGITTQRCYKVRDDLFCEIKTHILCLQSRAVLDIIPIVSLWVTLTFDLAFRSDYQWITAYVAKQ